MKGKYVRTQELKNHLRKLNSLRVVSEETRRKMSLARKGKPMSDETKQKIQKALIGKFHGGELLTPGSNRNDKRIRSTYGITEVEYDELLKSQNGVCKLCGKPETCIRKGVVIKLSIDHDHKTGRVRGLLCNSCNTALGKFEDNIELLSKAIEYLK